LGYRKGIITGLLLVSLGGFWFIPATHIAQFWAFLLGVCIVAMGLTFLETIANPYTTVLGDKRFAASRINLAQSFNGLGWPLGPIVGGMFFYSESGNAEAANQTLYIPYLGIAIFVLIIAALFMIVPLPELDTEDAYGADADDGMAPAKSLWRHLETWLSFAWASVTWRTCTHADCVTFSKGPTRCGEGSIHRFYLYQHGRFRKEYQTELAPNTKGYDSTYLRLCRFYDT
jgi:FHS family L-fucose permease-like MFS transporter